MSVTFKLTPMKASDIKDNPDAIYLKIAENKAILGPKRMNAQVKEQNEIISNSANYSRVVLGGSFSKQKDETNKDARPERTVSIILTGVDSSVAKAATMALSYWDRNQASRDTEAVEKKFNQFYAKRNEIYSSMGFDPATVARKKPELNRTQLQQYNSELGQYSVQYYEYHLALHIPGRKGWIRSKTFRSIRKFDITDLLRKVESWVLEDKSELDSQLIINTSTATEKMRNENSNSELEQEKKDDSLGQKGQDNNLKPNGTPSGNVNINPQVNYLG